MRKFKRYFLLSVFPLLVTAQPEPNVKSPAAKGIYAIWYESNPKVMDLPYIKGGQIVLQWADVEPKRERFDFSEIDNQLKDFAKKKLMTTIQINGNIKPAWMFEIIPHHPELLSHQIRNTQGSLMYWHPAFIDSYISLIKAYAEHLKKSPYLSSLAGVRMNFNGFGTEHFPVPEQYRSLDQWIVPPGAKQGTEWTEATADKYEDQIAEVFIKEFSGINLFMRNNISEKVEAAHKEDFLNGRIMLFHTSSEIEPRGENLEHNYKLFKTYAGSGHTLAYAEPWADSWGYHGPNQDKRWTMPDQYIYWRLLFDLNCGVSMIAVYGIDLGVAYNGKHPKEGDESQYQESFNKSLKMASMYAGYHASPMEAPGAWVAFRHNEKNVTYKSLKEFTGNYSYLMQQLPPDNMKWQDVTEVGPGDQRFGAWAKVLPEGQKVQLQMSELFAGSLNDKPAVVRIIYFDDKSGSFQAAFSGQVIKKELTGTGKWITMEIPVTKAAFKKDAAGANITLTALSGNITLHMVGVERGDGTPANVSGAMVSKSGNKIKLNWKNPADYDLDKINIYDGGKLLTSVSSVTEQADLKDIKASSVTIKSLDEAGRESAGINVKL